MTCHVDTISEGVGRWATVWCHKIHDEIVDFTAGPKRLLSNTCLVWVCLGVLSLLYQRVEAGCADLCDSWSEWFHISYYIVIVSRFVLFGVRSLLNHCSSFCDSKQKRKVGQMESAEISCLSWSRVRWPTN